MVYSSLAYQLSLFMRDACECSGQTRVAGQIWLFSIFQFGKSDGTLGFQIWKPAPGKGGGPSRIRIQESNANLLDRMQFS